MVDLALDTAAREPVAKPAEPLVELVRIEGGRRRRRRTVRWALVAVAAAMIGIGTFAWWPRPAPFSERFGTALVTRGDIVRRVSATGRVEARSTVQVGAQVSGRIAEVLVDFDDRVRTGQVLARFEVASFAAQLEQARAAVAAARADSRRAGLEVAEARREHERTRTLFARGVVGSAELDAAKDRVELAVAARSAARAQLALQQSALSVAQTTMGYTEIRAPIDGIVISREVEPGQTVAASFQAPVLFEIAEDLRRMRVLASIDEADVGEVAVRQPASFTVDAYPSRTFSAEVIELRSAPHLVQSVVTYDAVLYVDNDDLALKPGMTASVEIETAAVYDVLRVPNGALHFQLPDEAQADGDGLWLAAPAGPRRAPVVRGLTDGIVTAVEGELHEGDAVIVELTEAGRKAYGDDDDDD